MSIEKRIKDLGLTVPEVAKPVASYVPGVKTGNLIYSSGQLPMENGQLHYKGRLGEDLSIEEGFQSAKICFLNCLGVIKSLVGDLDKVKKVVKINGFVSSTANFTDHPKVINGASDLCLEIFGEKGKHARAAVGVAALPLGASVEVEVVVEVEE